MSQSAQPADFSPAPIVRSFSWAMLACLLAFLVNNYLTVNLRWPGIAPLFEGGDVSGQSWLQLGIYLALMAAAIVYALRSTGRSLRADASRVSALSAYLIRAAFWGVLLVGLVDAAISFLRVEGLLAQVVGEETAGQLGRSLYRGPTVHLPLMVAGAVIASFTRSLGFIWLALLIVVAELAIVITRFVFSYEQAFMGDLVRFWYAALFLFASAYTLLEDGHVRVDVFYAGFRDRTKGFINAWGAIILGLSVCWVILIVGMGSRSSIINSPMLNYEVSQSGFGMYTKYLMAGFLAVFAITMLIQFISQLLESVADWRNEPGRRPAKAGPQH